MQEESGVAGLLNHLDASFNLARWLMRNEHDAEDVVQEAYLRAFRYSASLQGGEGRNWLLMIVRNACYDLLKQKRNQDLSSPFDEELHGIDQDSLDPEMSLIRKARTELVREGLEELPAQLREVLVLRELEELSYHEIAAVAEVPTGTVMSRLSRARKRLQEILLAKATIER